jgi:hypothetical protein
MSMIDEWVGTEHWWNDTDKGKLKYSEQNLSQCHFDHHKSQTKWPGTESVRVHKFLYTYITEEIKMHMVHILYPLRLIVSEILKVLEIRPN